MLCLLNDVYVMCSVSTFLDTFLGTISVPCTVLMRRKSIANKQAAIFVVIGNVVNCDGCDDTTEIGIEKQKAKDELRNQRVGVWSRKGSD